MGVQVGVVLGLAVAVALAVAVGVAVGVGEWVAVTVEVAVTTKTLNSSGLIPSILNEGLSLRKPPQVYNPGSRAWTENSSL